MTAFFYSLMSRFANPKLLALVQSDSFTISITILQSQNYFSTRMETILTSSKGLSLSSVGIAAMMSIISRP